MRLLYTGHIRSRDRISSVLVTCATRASHGQEQRYPYVQRRRAIFDFLSFFLPVRMHSKCMGDNLPSSFCFLFFRHFHYPSQTYYAQERLNIELCLTFILRLQQATNFPRNIRRVKEGSRPSYTWPCQSFPSGDTNLSFSSKGFCLKNQFEIRNGLAHDIFMDNNSRKSTVEKGTQCIQSAKLRQKVDKID